MQSVKPYGSILPSPVWDCTAVEVSRSRSDLIRRWVAMKSLGLYRRCSGPALPCPPPSVKGGAKLGLPRFWWMLGRALTLQGLEGKCAPSQKQKSAATAHLPLEQLKPMHLPLDLPVAPAMFNCRCHRVVVSLQPRSKGLQLRDFGGRTRRQPSFQAVRIPVLKHLAKLLPSCSTAATSVRSAVTASTQCCSSGATLRSGLRQPERNQPEVGEGLVQFRRRQQ